MVNPRRRTRTSHGRGCLRRTAVRTRLVGRKARQRRRRPLNEGKAATTAPRLNDVRAEWVNKALRGDKLEPTRRESGQATSSSPSSSSCCLGFSPRHRRRPGLYAKRACRRRPTSALAGAEGLPTWRRRRRSKDNSVCRQQARPRAALKAVDTEPFIPSAASPPRNHCPTRTRCRWSSTRQVGTPAPRAVLGVNTFDIKAKATACVASVGSPST